jgi:DNA-binding response OmpR family regulator
MPAKILIVDDDPAIVNLLKEDLESEGYEVVCGFDGQMAIQLAKSQRPRLIILDVNMPLTSGLHAIESLRSFNETKSIPILVLTGEASRNVYPAIESLPRSAHLKKPIDLDELNSLVRHFLEKYPAD